MAWFRRVLFWAHLICGVVAGVIVLVMSITGVALTYQRQMQWWADTRAYRAELVPGAARAHGSALLAAASAAVPDAAPATIALRADPSMPAAVAMGPKTIYLNPYTTEVYGEGRGQAVRQFFTTMTSWHRYLGRGVEERATGRAVTGASNLLFLFLVLSGMYLWWPSALTWPRIRQVVWFRGGLRSKARDFNWHNTLGFWSALPLAIVVYSGTVISYPWSSNLVYRVVGEQPPAPQGGRGGGAGAAGAGGNAGARGAGEGGRGAAAGTERRVTGTPAAAAEGLWPSSALDLDAVVARVSQMNPAWKSLSMRVPTSPGAPVVVTLDRSDGGEPQSRRTVTMNAATGAIDRVEQFGDQTLGRRLRSILRFAHTGEVLGLGGQTIAGLVSAAAGVLVYTGLMLALRRAVAWAGQRKSTV